MKPARTPRKYIAPTHWAELPKGEYYREALEKELKPWFAKMYGFHLLKIGNLSAEINTEACAISHQVNVSLAGNPMQVRADPLHLPFAEKSVDACLLAHTLPWCSDPHRLLREADRVLIDDGWMILTGFNPVSLMGLRKLVPVLRKGTPYNSRMFTLMRQLDWLALLSTTRLRLATSTPGCDPSGDYTWQLFARIEARYPGLGNAMAGRAQQLVGGQFGAGGVVRTNVIHAGDRRLTINAHDRNMLLDALVHQRLRRLAGGDDNAGDAKLSETAQGLRQILLAVDLAHQRLKALALDLVKQRIKQGTAKRIADARDDHAD